jgi:hypothetical protein
MFPHEMQAVMAKIIFFIFAILVLCFSKVRASQVSTNALNTDLCIQNSLLSNLK